MKMKFALLFLPALMALSSCNAAFQPVAEKAFLEDTTAQSEVFGNKDIVGGNLQIKGRAKNEAIAKPLIGYQQHYEGGYLAIRFVAAIKDLNVKAYWRRGIAAPDGSIPRSKGFNNDGQEATKYYTSLSDGANVITAGSGDFEGYVGFVVYTLKNIPYEENKDSYVAAYLNLIGDEDGDSSIHNNSYALAVKIEKQTNYVSKNTFTFDPTLVEKHFLQGTIDGVVRTGDGLWFQSGSTPAGNFAWYENVTLKTTDSFGSFYYNHDEIFQYFGHDEYFDNITDHFNESSLSGYNAPVYNANYNLYVSSNNDEEHHIDNRNHMFLGVNYYQTSSYPMYFYGGGNGLWDMSNPVYKVYMWGDTENDEEVLSETATVDGRTVYKITKFDASKYRKIKVERWKSDWSEKWNDTGDLNNFYSDYLAAGSTPYYYFEITGWSYGGFHSYTPAP